MYHLFTYVVFVDFLCIHRVDSSRNSYVLHTETCSLFSLQITTTIGFPFFCGKSQQTQATALIFVQSVMSTESGIMVRAPFQKEENMA